MRLMENGRKIASNTVCGEIIEGRMVNVTSIHSGMVHEWNGNESVGEINDNCIGVSTIAYHDRHSKPTTTAAILTNSVFESELKSNGSRCQVKQKTKL